MAALQHSSAVVAFCDVDDTVLSALSASTARGKQWVAAMDQLSHAGVRIVICSSRTRAEVGVLQAELGLRHPFVCETGAAIYFPHGYFSFTVARGHEMAGYTSVAFGKPYPEVVAALHHAAARVAVDVVGFSDRSVQQLQTDQGIPALQARLATLREYTEPFTIVTGEVDGRRRLFKTLRTMGVDCITRGRYHYAGAVRRDIGAEFLCGLYRREFGSLLTVAFGDHATSAPLLRAVDMPVIVSADSVQTAALATDVPRAVVTTAASIATVVESVMKAARGRCACSRL